MATGNSNTTVLTHLKERVLTITLHRPEAKNAITADLTVQLHGILSAAKTDTNVGAVVLTGTGKYFCVGADLKAMPLTPTQKRQYSTEELLQLGAEATQLLHQMPKPTIAMIRGAAAGGGLSLAMGCDFRFADTTAKFSFAYPNIGLSGDFAGSHFIQYWIGPSKAREFCLLSPVVDANEACSLGLIGKVLATEALEAHVFSIAHKLANGPSYALARIKQNLNNSANMTIEESVAQENRHFMECRASADHKEAISAFRENRPPDYQKPQE